MADQVVLAAAALPMAVVAVVLAATPAMAVGRTQMVLEAVVLVVPTMVTAAVVSVSTGLGLVVVLQEGVVLPQTALAPMGKTPAELGVTAEYMVVVAVVSVEIMVLDLVAMVATVLSVLFMEVFHTHQMLHHPQQHKQHLTPPPLLLGQSLLV